MKHVFYSSRTGKKRELKGIPLIKLKEMFLRQYELFNKDGYFDESFGSHCVDSGDKPGTLGDVEFEILVKIQKSNLWPLDRNIVRYSEDDLFDIIEFLYLHVSKPIDGYLHNFGGCGMHWNKFDQQGGQKGFREKINQLLGLYERPFELSEAGEILQKAEEGFEPIFEAKVPSSDDSVTSRITSAISQFRRHGASLDDRRHAVRDLADILEWLKPKLTALITSKDEGDLFNIANNFGIRHHNDKQKTNYDTALWLSWMFYFYLATIHLVLRKMEKAGKTS